MTPINLIHYVVSCHCGSRCDFQNKYSFSFTSSTHARSPRKGFMSPNNLIINGGPTSSNQVFGFNAPGPSTPVTTTPPVIMPFTTSFVTSKKAPNAHIYTSAKSGPFTQVTTANHQGPTQIGFVNIECRNGHYCPTNSPVTPPESSAENSRTFVDEDRETSEHTVSKAISAKSFHTHRKISPPLNRPDHLRFS